MPPAVYRGVETWRSLLEDGFRNRCKMPHRERSRETLNPVNSGHLDRMCVQGAIQRAGGGLAERVLRVLQHLSWLSMSITPRSRRMVSESRRTTASACLATSCASRIDMMCASWEVRPPYPPSWFVRSWSGITAGCHQAINAAANNMDLLCCDSMRSFTQSKARTSFMT